MHSLLVGTVLALLMGGSAASLSANQEEGPKAPICGKCKSTGLLPCPEHPQEECALERDVLHCSEVAACAVCAGAAQVDCPKCDNATAEASLIKKRESSAQRGEKLKWVEKTWNQGRETQTALLRKVETAHFVLVWEMEGMKIERKRLNEHQTMHVYAQRLEQIFADYCVAFKTTGGDLQEKSVVLVWYLPNDQMDSSLRFCSSSSPAGVKLMGATPRYSVCANKQYFNADEDLHRNLAHNIPHLLLSHQKPSMWIGDKKYGWADEGLGHWFEDKYFGKCTNYCYQEQNTRVDFKSGKYRVAVREMVASGKCPTVGEVFARTVQDLTPPEHAIAFSYVDYLLFLDGAKYNEMMRLCRRKIPTRDALQTCFEMNPLQFEEKWKAWVLETYPTR